MYPSPFLAQVSEWLGVIAVAMLAGISPRFVRRPLKFVHPRREINVALALIAAGLVVALIVYRFFPPAAGQPPLPRLIAGLLSLFLYAMALRVRAQPVRSAGWGQATFRPSILMGLALAVLALFLRGKIFTLAGGVGRPEALALLAWLGVCAAEETIFRGYVQLRLVSAWGQWPGIAASAFAYALWQLPLRLVMGLELQAVLTGLLLALAQGLVLGYVMQKSGHVISGILYRTISEWAAAVL